MEQKKNKNYIFEENEALQSIRELANEELMPIAHKLKGLAGLFFCETAGGREMDGEELNGISSFLKGLSSEIHAVYDKLHVGIKRGL